MRPWHLLLALLLPLQLIRRAVLRTVLAASQRRICAIGGSAATVSLPRFISGKILTIKYRRRHNEKHKEEPE
jgi:hypothetical protein